MAPTILWFERRFAFPIPPEQYAHVCARLAGAPYRLEETLRGAPEDRRVFQPGGKWSAQEQAGHMLDLETLWLTRVTDFFTEGVTELTVTDLTNRRTTEAAHNEKPLESILAAFALARRQLLDRLGRIGRSDPERTLLHPRMKVRMTLIDHLYFVAEHDDYHLTNINSLLAD
jgi:uncharacterized damage-inducible protein DinB